LAALSGTLLYAALDLGLRVNENVAASGAIAVVVVTNWASRHYRLQTQAAWSLQARRQQRSRAPRVSAKPPRVLR
jgi:hypothetical protein